MRVGFIYALCHPNTGEVRYVGLSTDPRRRLRAHTYRARQGVQTHVSAWLRSLKALPHIVILDEATSEDLPALERHYVEVLKTMGLRLTNLTAGGDGTLEMAPEVRTRLTALHIERVKSPEYRKRVSLALTGTKKSPEAKANHAAAMRSPETRAKCREAARRQWERMTPQQRQELTAKQGEAKARANR